MKKASKVLALCVCAVLLVTASVLGTMAYLTDNATVTNTFTVGNVAITMDETDVTNPGGDRVIQNAYKLIPGQTYTKDPIIHVGDSSEDCYLFVKVENEIANIEGDRKIASQMEANGWQKLADVENVYVHTDGEGKLAKASKGADVSVFESFTVAGAIENDDLSAYSNAKITVTAYAIQAGGFEGKSASEIWTAAGFTA